MIPLVGGVRTGGERDPILSSIKYSSRPILYQTWLYLEADLL